jgi:hypothetical protein
MTVTGRSPLVNSPNGEYKKGLSKESIDNAWKGPQQLLVKEYVPQLIIGYTRSLPIAHISPLVN